MDKWIPLIFGFGGSLPWGSFHSKKVSFCSTITELRMYKNRVFLVPVKYTLVSHVPTLAITGLDTF